MTYDRRVVLLPGSPRDWALILAVISLLMSLRSTAYPGSTLDLSSASVVSASQVLLRDIVSNPAILPDSWADRQVMEAPEPGKSMDYLLTTVAFALQKYPDMKDVTLRGQVSLRVERSGGSLPPDIFRNAIRTYVDECPDFSEKSLDIVFDPVPDLVIASGTPDVAVTSHRQLRDPYRYNFDLVVTDKDKVEKNISTAVTMTPLRKVWVARNHLQRGHVLDERSLELQSIPANTPGEFLQADDIFSGMELNRSVRAGEPIRRDFLLDIVCAERGDIIFVNAERGNLTVSLKAKALSPGRRGERILCLNEQSKRRLSVTLTAPKEARVDI